MQESATELAHHFSHTSSGQDSTILIEDPKVDLHISVASGCTQTVSVRFETQDVEDAEVQITVVVETGASLTLLVLQNADVQNMRIKQRSTIKQGGSLKVHNVTLGGLSVDHTVANHLEERDAISDIRWAFFAQGNEKYSIDARNVFHAENGGGEILLKGVAEEKAHVSCNGMIDIQAGGRGTDTYLTEDVLMLDSTAKVDAIPGLEIKTNDVKASHSATVSQVTPLDLFYFAARGIDETQARRMYIEGFLEDVCSDLDLVFQEQIAAAIDAKYVAEV